VLHSGIMVADVDCAHRSHDAPRQHPVKTVDTPGCEPAVFSPRNHDRDDDRRDAGLCRHWVCKGRSMLRLPLLAACLLGCGWATGCATHVRDRSAPGRVTAPVPADSDYGRYEAVPAAALVFTPPVVRQEPPLDLSREGRATEAFVGYEQGIVEYHYVRTDDRQRAGDGWNRGWGWGSHGGHGDRYERRAVTERVGVRYR
jgi:hypothetical protein